MPRSTPRLTFTALIRLLAAPSHARTLAILRAQKEEDKGAVQGYRRVEGVIVNHLVDGLPLKAEDDFRPFEHGALEAFTAIAGLLPAATFVRPSPNAPKLDLHGVEVSCAPTVGFITDQAKAGFLKLYLNQSPRLGDFGQKMATLAWYHLNRLGADIDKPMVQVIDVRGQVIHAAGAHVQFIERLKPTCRLVTSVWDQV